MHLTVYLGHGRLSMADGGYYKGTFVNGEIQGHGFRLFGLNGCTYTGEFYQGEMNGQGIYKTPQGLHYEGNWLDNKREGLSVCVHALYSKESWYLVIVCQYFRAWYSD